MLFMMTKFLTQISTIDKNKASALTIILYFFQILTIKQCNMNDKSLNSAQLFLNKYILPPHFSMCIYYWTN